MKTASKTSTTWVVGLTSVASLMVALDLLVVSTALSTIRDDLDTSVELLQWTITAYGLAFACLLMTGAALGDRFGRRRMFTSGLVLFAAASATCALASSIGWLIAARAVQGVGAALVLPLAVALLSGTVPPERRGRALGIFEGVTGLATIAGPPVGGSLAQSVGWEWIFWINLPIAVAVIFAARARISESHGPDAAIDIVGLLLVTGAGFGLIWALVRGNGSGMDQPGILAALVAGAVLAGPSSAGSAVTQSRCCLWACSGHERSRPALRPASWVSPRCTVRCSSWPSSCRRGSATHRSRPGFG